MEDKGFQHVMQSLSLETPVGSKNHIGVVTKKITGYENLSQNKGGGSIREKWGFLGIFPNVRIVTKC